MQLFHSIAAKQKSATSPVMEQWVLRLVAWAASRQPINSSQKMREKVEDWDLLPEMEKGHQGEHQEAMDGKTQCPTTWCIVGICVCLSMHQNALHVGGEKCKSANLQFGKSTLLKHKQQNGNGGGGSLVQC